MFTGIVKELGKVSRFDFAGNPCRLEVSSCEVFKEVGDLFFAMSNVSRHLGVNPEVALRQANKKFMDRFRFIEEKLEKKGKALDQASLEEMDKIWE